MTTTETQRPNRRANRPPIPRRLRECGRDPFGGRWVYCYWDRGGTLLYVGISTDAYSRAVNHRTDSSWWRFVATGFAFLDDEDKPAHEIERMLIHSFRPLFNATHTDWSDVATIEYAAHREAWDIVDDLLDVSGLGKHAELFV